MCSDHVGVVPIVGRGDGIRIPILVDGVEVFEDQDPGPCDNTDFKGNCQVGSRIGRVQGTDVAATPLSDVLWVYFCRSAGKEHRNRSIDRAHWTTLVLKADNRRGEVIRPRGREDRDPVACDRSAPRADGVPK